MRVLGMMTAAALALAAVSNASDAFAQRRGNNMSVVAVNSARVITESAIGRDYTTKMGQIRQETFAPLAPEAQAIQQEAQRLEQVTRSMSEAQIRNNSQVQAFQTRRQQFATREQGVRADLACTQLITQQALMTQIRPVLQAVAQQRSAGVIVDASSAVYVAPEVDITSTVIQQLDQNQATRAATVARHAAAECQNQQTAGQ